MIEHAASTSHREVILSARSLDKDFRDGPRTISVLKNLFLDLHRGEAVAIEGRSGSGKSTLLHLLGLLDQPTSGQIYFKGLRVDNASAGRRNSIRGRSIGFVFQAYHLVSELTALENVLLAGSIAGCSGRESRRKARSLLEQVGLSKRLKHRPAKLSGGESQRVAIARALMGSPEVLLADEPTGNLDLSTADEVENVLFEIVRELDLSMLLVTHASELAQRCDRTLFMEDGSLHLPGSKEKECVADTPENVENSQVVGPETEPGD